MLVHTWWCWHTLRRRWSLKGREGFGFGENEMHTFYCTNGNFGEVAGEKHSPDVGLGGTGHCSCMCGALSFLARGKGARDAQHRMIA